MKVIIADDSSTIRRILENMLTSIGYTDLLQADGGDVVIELLSQHDDVGLILMDWNMPVMNGLDCLRAIRANPQTGAIPVIMVTSEALRERIVEAIQCGANGYLMKPFDVEKLKKAVAGIVK